MLVSIHEEIFVIQILAYLFTLVNFVNITIYGKLSGKPCSLIKSILGHKVNWTGVVHCHPNFACALLLHVTCSHKVIRTWACLVKLMCTYNRRPCMVVTGDVPICENNLMSSVGKEFNETKATSYVHQPLSVAVPCMAMNSHTNRSIKRRPRSRRDTRAALSSFDQPAATLNTANGGGNMLSADSNLNNNYCSRASTTHAFGISLADSQQNNNYLEFLLQSDGSLMHNIQIFSPEFPVFLTNNPQWEKLPVLYSESNSNSSLPDCNSKSEPDSCSPDSVITNFTTDVFDSLEPLSSTPSEWWVVQ